ncbi:hypothetical protein A3K29_01300 [Candidatus Collierbacteria bacterium RIFOXYB2_FULL_46_14]|uniref:Uncharacterized protein n=1 Tax=Candidatus Collierbacteria bacterium GW2011_GWA2_46_26 TaxID=1618381 RepID=A0A0G1PJC4_9BACT|nr:MAG: hypothetical protein UW29_C0009G0002 [Candidatus Collierbacteria bacterium GW2011_GWC2_44_13]KKU32787.1 MAG: hypothetical protein UX47_C0007G0031 [Candidatus Collierbacteria bacterium GW2011_GWA2_46_26]OGD72767.1 MAG: hypothetical protein A3K29_01300 [Candidatus Collierbacteria bacterium RIFOXYB2_FULL_46_14]OGD75809.1 MAG: hypothetical protein A3K43_01300 [Candidatus Collierbacteria bacterium RIFOXYA2_FULL_46_20]OGD77145.1 MAG: hypothetical protein A3K39_01300 [Candidatus Collierbacteri
MNKNIIIGSSLVLTLLAGGVYASRALAYRGNPAIQGPNYSAERHEAMEKAFETNNYEAWKTQIGGRGRVSEIVNKDNFAEFAKAHQLAEAGRLDESNAIRTNLGLNLQRGSGQGRGMGRNR